VEGALSKKSGLTRSSGFFSPYVIYLCGFASLREFSFELEASYEGSDCLDLVIHHFLRKTRVGSKEERLIHDGISARHLSDHTESCRAILAELHENRLAEEIPSKEHPIADLLLVQMARQIRVSEWCGGLYSKHEAEPGTMC
jgi:hypothetical protein